MYLMNKVDLYSAQSYQVLRVDDNLQDDIWFPTVFFHNLRGMSLMPSVTQSRARFVFGLFCCCK
jgi:hypothetical protein